MTAVVKEYFPDHGRTNAASGEAGRL